MRTPVRISVAAIFAFGLAVACGKSRTTIPTSPTSPTSPTATATAVRVTIDGPTNVIPGQAIAFKATAMMSDGSQQDYTRKVSWSSWPANVLSLSVSTGEGFAGLAGDAQVNVSAPPPSPGSSS